MSRILLNVDIGERGPEHAEDQALLGFVDIANIACGGHAGSAQSVDRFRTLAENAGIEVTAHVSYPDRAHFGRRSIPMPFAQLRTSLDAQLAMMPGIRAVKCHGALYNDCCSDPQLAKEVAGWMATSGISRVLTLPGSELDRACQSLGIQVVAEAFAERRYAYCGESQRLHLVPRTEAFASITDVEEALEQARTMIHRQQVRALHSDSKDPSQARIVDLEMDTLCIHSDSPIAIDLAMGVAKLLKESALPSDRRAS